MFEMSWIDFFKTFAGPIATIIASAAALVVTRRLGVAQLRIAQSQADTAAAQKEIAFDKLKHDLFDKRYEIYQAAKEVIEIICRSQEVNVAALPKVEKLRLKLDEARFFFQFNIQALCENIENQVRVYLSAELAKSGFSEDNPKHHDCRDIQTKVVEALDKIYPELAKLFERDLRFEQLTKP
jgi:hypothetical protein